jgi:hypothetical protein
MLVVLALFVLAIVVAGCSKNTASEPQQPGTPTAAPSGGGGEEQAPPAIQKAGEANAPVKLVAYYPMNKDHKPIADYLLTLPKQYGESKVYVEAYDMQSPEGSDKWGKSGLQCAGVFVNGKTNWEVLRGGKKEQVNFIKRMGSYWAKEDLLAVIDAQLKDPKAVPEVPVSAKKTPPAEKQGEAKAAEQKASGEKPTTAAAETKPAPKGK